ncbi:SWIM zinc finger family protein [Streptomyces sp. 891-h]|uniref:SWIM zinc finger family protein n=1 Tax=Streptomyces sp. 891-h TaxID=2720714 RepID=UPI001FA94DF8|nr:SWIM zinc finger family protein [Streptomyces sp. 891-h]UNZ17712.1 SWIM zinc finger family protein [Streptomyces sp. 891-h]
MGGQAVRWTAEQVMALAPDVASRRAGSKLSAPGPWTEAGSGGGAVWGLCKGSGSKPYQTVVDLDGGQGIGYKCSCPSRKFPCKHALGLLLLWAGDEAAVAEQGEPPQWAEGWLSGRRQRAEKKAGRSPGGEAASGGGRSAGRAGGETGARDGGEGAAGAEAAEGEEGDARSRAEAARRRAEQRAARITAGAEELEQRLADLLRGGLAGTEQSGYAPWEEMAARMVDAQAPGLANRIRELGAVPGSGAGWPERLLEECALLHLLARGWMRADELPGPLAETVRSRVGLTVEAAELLADEQGLVRDEWLVLAQSDTDEGRLTARRIWLHGRATGRPALLLSFGVGGRPPELALPVGATLDAELAYYPGASPLRAALGERHDAPLLGFRPPGHSIPQALDAYAGALRDDPWLEGWPCVLRDVIPVPPSDSGPSGGSAGPQRGVGGRAGGGTGGSTASRPGGGSGEGWQLAAADEETALPVAPGTGTAALWRLLAISGDGPVTVFGECGHRGFSPYTAWSEGKAVPL